MTDTQYIKILNKNKYTQLINKIKFVIQYIYHTAFILNCMYMYVFQVSFERRLTTLEIIIK